MVQTYPDEQEFRTWLIEERRLNPEMIPRERTYKEFAVFVEDHNTGMSRSEAAA